MCLRIDEDIKIKWDKNGEAVAWKIYDFKKPYGSSVYFGNEATLVSHYMCTVVHASKLGWIRSCRDSKALSQGELSYKEVESGIHVFLVKHQADNFLKKSKDIYGAAFNRTVLIKVMVKKSDLVSTGTWGYGEDYKNAVFTKIKLSKEDIKKYNVSRK